MKISEKQLAQVNDRIKALVTAGSFYGKKLEEAGITSVANAEEFEKLPFSEKADLRDAYPLGLMTAPEEEIVRTMRIPEIPSICSSRPLVPISLASL